MRGESDSSGVQSTQRPRLEMVPTGIRHTTAESQSGILGSCVFGENLWSLATVCATGQSSPQRYNGAPASLVTVTARMLYWLFVRESESNRKW